MGCYCNSLHRVFVLEEESFNGSDDSYNTMIKSGQ